MSNLGRPPLHDKKTTKHGVTESPVPRSPRLRDRRNANLNNSHLDSNQDSSLNSDIEQESEDKNNSGQTRKGRSNKAGKKKTERLYPHLPAEEDDDEEEEEGNTVRKQRGNKSKETKSGGSTRVTDHDRDERDSPQRNSARKEQDSGWNFKRIVTCMVVVVIILAIVAPSVLRSEQTVLNPKHVDKYKIFKQEIEPLRSKFQGQSERFWRTVVTTMKHVLLEDSPTYPAIVLFSVPHDQPKLGPCLTKHIIQRIMTIQKLSGDFYIDGTELDKSSPSKTKLDLDKRLHATLNSSTTVIIDHVEKLPAEAALLLHAYCDGDNAPYKKAVIFLVLHTQREILDTESRPDECVEQILVDLWKAELGEDEMPALQSRIANNIAIMNPEKADVCK